MSDLGHPAGVAAEIFSGAFTVPALVAGLLTTHIGLLNTALGYGGFVALVAVGTLTVERLTGREHSEAAQEAA